VRIAWAVSGKGLIARSVMEAHSNDLLQSKLDLVLFDRADATRPMIEWCESRKVSYAIVAPSNIEVEFIRLRDAYEIDSMGLTFNRLIPPSVIDAFKGNIFNLHMSLLPAFPGFGATRRAIESGETEAGVTVHFIDAGVDTGPIIAQQRVPIHSNDTAETLGRRQFEAAVPLILQTVRCLEMGKISTFSTIDDDLREFGAAYCARL